MQVSLTHALVSVGLKLAQRVHFRDNFFFMGVVNMKTSNLDAFFARFKCHMDRSHYKADFITL